MKTEASEFCEISCTRGNGNPRKLKHPIFENFHVPGVMEIEKTEASDFCEISCTRGHENSRKVKHLIFEKFHVPG